MYAAFLDFVLGHRTPESSASPGSTAADGAGHPTSMGSSAQHRATTRPYHCSQNSFSTPRAHSAGHASFSGTSGRDTEGDFSSFNNNNTITNAAAGGGGGSSFGLSFAKVGKQSLRNLGASVGLGGGSAPPTASPSPSTAGPLQLHKLHSATPTGAAVLYRSHRSGTPAYKASAAASPASSINAATAAVSAEHAKRFQAALAADPVDVPRLRELSWQGCPVALRYEAWMFLTGCWTAQSVTRQPNVVRRRVEYAAYIHSSYGIVDWDAVCAMVDSGVDTAVRRSTLKTIDQTAAAAGTPRDGPLADSLASLPLGGSRRIDAGGGDAGTLTAAAAPRPRGLQRASVSLEDVRSLMQQRPRSAATSADAAVTADGRTGAAVPHDVTATPAPDALLDGGGAGAVSVGHTDGEGAPFAAEPSSAWLLSGSGVMGAPLWSAARDPSLTLPSTTSDTSNTAITTTSPLGAAAAASSGGAFGVPPGSVPTPAAGHQLSVSTMLGSKELQTLKQIRKDIPRMSGGLCYLRHPRVQGSIERVLFIWSLRHPACGYVQGMNDLVVPFMGVVLGYRFCSTRSITELHAYTEDIFDEVWSVAAVPVTQWINEVEADVYWMMSYLLNTMQDSYTSSHAGITTMVRHLAAVVQAADAPLYHRLVDVMQLQFEQFTFRWMNCLLMRELTETQSLRLLDSYLSDEERRWSVTHVYVCAALLLRWGPQLMSFGEDYISAMKLLQSPPTEQLSPRDMQDVLSEAFVLQNLYEASLSRLAAPNSTS